MRANFGLLFQQPRESLIVKVEQEKIRTCIVKYASTNEDKDCIVGDDVIGSYIGYDFGKPVRIIEVTRKIRMLSYKIQYSDDLEKWTDDRSWSEKCLLFLIVKFPKVLTIVNRLYRIK